MKVKAAMARKAIGALVNQKLMYLGGLNLEKLKRITVVSNESLEQMSENLHD